LLKRVFDIDVEHCPNCGGALKIIAAIEDPPVIVKILSHLGLPPAPRRVPQLVESIYSRRSDSRKSLANASRRRRSLRVRPTGAICCPRAPAISAPPPTLPSKTPTRPQLLLNSAVLDRLGALAIYPAHKKGGLKILSI